MKMLMRKCFVMNFLNMLQSRYSSVVILLILVFNFTSSKFFLLILICRIFDLFEINSLMCQGDLHLYIFIRYAHLTGLSQFEFLFY